MVRWFAEVQFFTYFFEVILGCKMDFKCPTLLKHCQNVGDMDRSLCQKMGSLLHLEMEIQPKVTSNFLKREFQGEKFDKFVCKKVVEMKNDTSRGGFITQNQAGSQNLSSLGDLKP